MPKTRRIILSDKKHDLPFSKGLMAQSIMATGLPPTRAYDIAESIERSLVEKGTFSISSARLRKIIFEYLKKEIGVEYSERYLGWQALAKLDKPVIILIGGTTGVGKSTIATMLAHRLGITRISSTDAIREVMRAFFSIELMPFIYYSSFNADAALRIPLAKSADPVLMGFREQVAAVAVGMDAIIERAVKEGTSMILEGVHCVPGFVNLDYFSENEAFIVPYVITVEEEALHRSHFYVREMETDSSRPYDRYIAYLENIRKIQKYIKSMAKESGVRVFDSVNLDSTVKMMLEEILAKVQRKKS